MKSNHLHLQTGSKYLFKNHPNVAQRGASLVVSLIMLLVVSMLGISATQIALQGEKASRGERDRQIAMQSAEAALMDAQMDIRNSPDATLSRSSLFQENSKDGFSTGCGSNDNNPYLGLCLKTEGTGQPVWLTVDFTDVNSSTAKSVPFGKFTGQKMQVGKAMLTSQLPRYIIEVIEFRQEGRSVVSVGENTDSNLPTFFYRITAMGFGASSSTKVVLQSFFRKVD